MIGPMSSSLSLAQRTASKARATMDDMTRQIATGQRVSSVKDDGAAWTRANRLRSDAVASEALSSSLGRVRAGVLVAQTVGDARTELLVEMRGIALAATNTTLSAGTRQDLQNDYTQLRNAYLGDQTYTAHAGSIELNNPGGTAWGPYSGTVGVADLSWINDIDGTASSQIFSAALGAPTADISTATAAAATLGSVQAVEAQLLQRVSAFAGLEREIDSDRQNLATDADRLASFAASLTEADLGKASTARAKAETRQQLALGTIQQAISAYGNFAGGLLGNVQRTQRGLVA
jgi:flagellin